MLILERLVVPDFGGQDDGGETKPLPGAAHELQPCLLLNEVQLGVSDNGYLFLQSAVHVCCQQQLIDFFNRHVLGVHRHMQINAIVDLIFHKS